ncbi:hypothetical protein HDU87_005628 [Geranomyces variabilis]|uniref:Glycosyltransferase n=1 Tax=Geranomyces variabilis TaxID=109894 RepID=A0AAD5TM10_9FUNG|nr:hypothetical protein HDU87_005628 [Geranomyces variabilis]
MTVNGVQHIFLLTFPLAGHYLPTLRLAARLAKDPAVTVSVASSAVLAPKLKAAALPGVNVLALEDGLSEGEDLIRKSWRFSKMQVGPIVEAFWTAVEAHRSTTKAVVLEFFLARAISSRIQGMPVFVFYPLSVNATLKAFVEGSRAGKFDETFLLEALQCSTGPGWVHDHITDAAQLAVQSDGILIDSFEDFELEDFVTLRSIPPFHNMEVNGSKGITLGRVPVRLVGPLFSPAYLQGTSAPTHSEGDQAVLDFLSEKGDDSVVYISFGSHAPVINEQMAEIAKALLKSDRPFIWGLRSTEALPADFAALTKDRGLVLSWAPQHLILSHRATGVFVTHAGWNSVLEAVGTGTPMVAWPLFGDQVFNADLVARRNLGAVVGGAEIDMCRYPHEPARIVPCEEIRAAIGNVNEAMRDAAKDLAAKAWATASKIADEGLTLC